MDRYKTTKTPGRSRKTQDHAADPNDIKITHPHGSGQAGNNSKSLLEEIQQMAYSLLRSRHMTKKVYHQVLNFVKK